MAELQPCGTVTAYKRHHRHNQKPCEACRQANNEYERTRRWEQGLNDPYTQPECGTVSGYNRHYYTDTEVCQPCRLAHTEYMRTYRTDLEKRRRRGSWKDVVVDYLETHGPMSMKELHYLITLRHDDLGMPTLQKTVRRLVKDSEVGMRMVHMKGVESSFGQGIYSRD